VQINEETDHVDHNSITPLEEKEGREALRGDSEE
jgi:hypothetical protein